MSNNISIGANFVVATVAETFINLGFNSTNCNRIYATINGNYRSWQPSRPSNPINSTVIGVGYLIESKVFADRTSQFSPPLPAGTSNPNAIVDLDDSELIDNP